MSGYTKLFSSILASSIWNEPDDVRIVWITLLAMADKSGMVDASIGGIAHQARKTREVTEHALSVLESPDPDSRNPDHGGRRIEKIVGRGYKILNYEQFRNTLSDDAETVASRERMRRMRERQRNSDVTSRNTGAGAAAGDGVDMSSEGVEGETGVSGNATEPPAPQPMTKGAGLSVVVDAIMSARPDLRLNAMTIENALHPYLTPDLTFSSSIIRAVNTLLAEWVNMPDPPAKPLGMLEAYLRNAEKYHGDNPQNGENDPGILAYAKQYVALRNRGAVLSNDTAMSDLFVKIRDNYGPQGVDRVKRAAKEIHDVK